MVRHFGLAIGLTLAAGCSLATIPNGVVLCSSGTCPSGFACEADGRCWQLGTGPDAGPPVDGGKPDAGPGDAGNDGGADAGSDGSSAFDCGITDAGGCVICSTDGVFPDLLYPRWGLGGVYLKQTNGSETFDRVYAVGGFDPSGTETSSVQLDELDTGNAWSPVGNANLTPRSFFSVVSNAFIGLIAFGGEDLTTGMVLGDTVIFPSDVAPIPTSGWVEASPVLLQPRENHAAVVEANGGAVITCGGSAEGIPLGTCETLSLETDLDGGWEEGPQLVYERDGLSMALGSDGNVYAFSGSGSNPTGLTNWEMLGTDGGWGCPGTCPQMNSGHVFGAAVAVGTKIYVMGGVAEPADQTSNNTVEYIDVTNLAAGWQEVAGMLTARAYFAAVATPEGTIRVFGGHGGPLNSCTIANVEEYSPSSNTWR